MFVQSIKKGRLAAFLCVKLNISRHILSRQFGASTFAVADGKCSSTNTKNPDCSVYRNDRDR